MFWTLLGITIAVLSYFALVKPFNYWKRVGVPQKSVLIIWRGTLFGFLGRISIFEAVINIYNDFPGKRYSGIYQFYRPVLVLRDPDLIKQITIKDFDHFVDHLPFLPENSEPLWEKNLIARKGDKWRDMRSTLSPSFTSSKMKIMFGLISDCAKEFVRYHEEQNAKVVTVEMKDVFTRFTNDVIATTAFGITCDSLRNRDNDFYLMGKMFTDFTGLSAISRIMFILMVPNLAKRLGVTFLHKQATQFFKKLIEDNIHIRETEGVFRQDMINLLLESRKQRSNTETADEKVVDVEFAVVEESSETKKTKLRKDTINNEDIIAQALLFFFAGFASVSTLMCFTAYELAVNPDIQERLQTEVDNTLSDCGGSLTYEALSKMKYMDMVISESLRKWPATFVTDRICVKPYTIAPVGEAEQPIFLKKGDAIWISTAGIHRDPGLYPEPERFNPERFSDEKKSKIAPCTFLPFGLGPRSCIGNRFALMETKLIFFYILSKCNIVVVEKTQVPFKISKRSGQLDAEGGFWLGLKSRKVD